MEDLGKTKYVGVSAIIVTHNSEQFLPKCVQALLNQTHPLLEIIIVDSGSETTTYLDDFKQENRVTIKYCQNIGFARANNIGYRHISDDSEFVVFVNPDTFLEREVVHTAVHILRKNKVVTIVSGKLLGFNIEKNSPTGIFDSTGIFRKMYGRWYDRGQGKRDTGLYDKEEIVPALCGALLFCRLGTQYGISRNENVFDQDFFLYKEDIELSLRIRKNGGKLLYSPALKAFHCRGWRRREEIPFDLRLAAAESEILLYKKHPSPYIFWALFKYYLVRYFKV